MATDIMAALQQLDLTKNEAAVYVALLKHGFTNVGPVVAATGLHRQLVYEALQKLTEQGLATSIIKNNRKHFQAAAPSTLLRLVKQKEHIAATLVPLLTSLQSAAGDSLEVRTLYGRQGFFDNLKELIESAAQTDHIMRIIGGAHDVQFYATLGNLYPKYVQLLESLNVKKYLIAAESFSDEFKQKFANEEGSILKMLPSGLSSPTYTRITPEMVAIEIYSSEPVVIQIRNKAVARGYLDHFELLWKQAKLFSPSP